VHDLIYEFKDTGSKLRQLYRELKAAHIEKVVCPHGHIGAIPEGHLRDLSKLPPEQWSNAWSEVIATAPPKGVTTKHVSNVVQHLLEQSNQGKTATTVEQQEGFSIGDWVKIQRSGTWYGMQGSVNRIEEHEITVQLNEGKWKHLRFYREELLKALPFEQSTSSQNSFYNRGDLLIIDCPTGVDCDYKRFNGCWAIVNGIGELGSIKVQLAGRTMRVKKSDTEPIDNPSVVLKEIAEKVTTLLERKDLDSFDRRFLEMYLKRCT
jgi:preprotein translocase subunit YajC